MVDLVHRNLRDHIRVVLAQFLFRDRQYRSAHRRTWDQRDRLDATHNCPGLVDQEWLAQSSPHGGLFFAFACDGCGAERTLGDPDDALWRQRHGRWDPSARNKVFLYRFYCTGVVLRFPLACDQGRTAA